MQNQGKNLARHVRTSSPLNPAIRAEGPTGPLGLICQHFRCGFVTHGSNVLVDVPEEHLLIADVWVRRERRGQGLARGMIERVIEAAAGEGVRSVYMDVPSDSRTFRRSLALAKGLGFRFHSATKASVILRREISPDVR